LGFRFSLGSGGKVCSGSEAGSYVRLIDSGGKEYVHLGVELHEVD